MNKNNEEIKIASIEYSKADKKGKALLEKIFGKEVFENKRIKTFEDACKTLKLDSKKVIPDFSCYPEKDKKAMEAHAKFIIIVRASNKLENNGKEWTPDWSNDNEYKYYPWFDMSKGSSGFRYDAYDDWHAVTGVGSRLCFKTEELAEYTANMFIDLYKAYFLM